MGGFICNGLDSSDDIEFDIDYELCARWIQLSTFSPLFLIKTSAQNDNIFVGDELSEVFQSTVKFRNSMIPHLYTIFLNSTGNNSIIKPLFYNFPNDTNIFNYSNITQNEFTIGKAFLATPILDQSIESLYAYFPSASW